MTPSAALIEFPRLGIERAAELPRRRPTPSAPWTLPALEGRLVELSGIAATAGLTLACALLCDAQQRGEPAAWVSPRESFPFPPDLAAGGVDLERLPVVFAPDVRAAGRAADRLLRSGGFGLVVLDLTTARRLLPQPFLARLAGLAEQHEATLLCLTEKADREPSLGSLVSLRVVARRETTPDGFRCRLEAVKDKRRPPGWTHDLPAAGPPGL